MSLPQHITTRRDGDTSPIPFPRQPSDLRPAAREVFETLEGMSRRIEDLARELNCLGYFDQDDDRPRAA